jgi:hypothetical protein
VRILFPIEFPYISSYISYKGYKLLILLKKVRKKKRKKSVRCKKTGISGSAALHNVERRAQRSDLQARNASALSGTGALVSLPVLRMTMIQLAVTRVSGGEEK